MAASVDHIQDDMDFVERKSDIPLNADVCIILHWDFNVCFYDYRNYTVQYMLRSIA